jgi:hypothetical protein
MSGEQSHELGAAIVRTIAYGDIFDYPLTAHEVTRYLIRERTSADAVSAALERDPLVAHHVASSGGYYFLKNRSEILDVRRRRAVASARVWPRAVRYGRALARLPFVRMVAVTGALAVDNLGSRPDIDYLIVTEPGRLWSARAHIIAVVRLVAPFGDTICPNYFVSESVLALQDRNLFTAHEVAQMVPLSGFDVYERLRAVNDWTSEFLPNAAGTPSGARTAASSIAGRRLQALAERAGRTTVGGRFEHWEMTRKLQRFADAAGGQPETVFSADVCKGHFAAHGTRILGRFQECVGALNL